MRTTRNRPLLVITFLLFAKLSIAGSLDRIYTFGDDAEEGAVAGAIVGSGVPGGTPAASDTFDSAFLNLGDGSIVDLRQVRNPIYVEVDDRPDGNSGLGIQFDATNRQYLRGFRLGFPQTSRSSIEATVQNLNPSTGPLDYRGIVDRGMQFWVKPSSDQGSQSLVADTNQHGVIIQNGNYTMRYGGTDYETDVPVIPDQWNHIMMVSQDSTAILYVDGVAVSAVSGDYDVFDTADLVIASNTAGAENDFFFTGGTSSYFDGVIDDMELFVYGSNSTTNFGQFDFFLENAFARDVVFAGSNLADVNLDGLVSGDGSGPAASDDVTAFVEGFFTTNFVNGIQVGDIDSRMQGDLDVNGIVDLRDWGILNDADPAMGTLVLSRLVPEPSSCTLLSLLSFVCLMHAGKRRQLNRDRRRQ